MQLLERRLFPLGLKEILQSKGRELEDGAVDVATVKRLVADGAISWIKYAVVLGLSMFLAHTFLAVTRRPIPVRTGSYAARSWTWICTPPTVFPWNLENVGAKYASLKCAPGRPSPRRPSCSEHAIWRTHIPPPPTDVPKHLLHAIMLV